MTAPSRIVPMSPNLSAAPQRSPMPSQEFTLCEVHPSLDLDPRILLKGLFFSCPGPCSDTVLAPECDRHGGDRSPGARPSSRGWARDPWSEMALDDYKDRISLSSTRLAQLKESL